MFERFQTLMSASHRVRSQAVIHHKRDALLIIDCVNDLEFPGGEKVLPWAERLAPRLAKFANRLRRNNVPVIYVNDNFGRWHSNFSEVYKHCTRAQAKGRHVARILRPSDSDYSILKPRHSGFFSTSLRPLLEDLGVRRVILTGIATNLCVLFTAHDAHMYHYKIVVLSDCCAAETDFDHNVSLTQLQRFCRAKVCLSTEYRFKNE